jgi:hypothetical protein
MEINSAGYDPTGCQAKMGDRQLDYIANQVDAAKRMKRGQQQKLCAVCLRWRWHDKQCKDFREEKS